MKAVEQVPGLLDLEVSENEEFSPDKLRATLERFYVDVVCCKQNIGLSSVLTLW